MPWGRILGPHVSRANLKGKARLWEIGSIRIPSHTLQHHDLLLMFPSARLDIVLDVCADIVPAHQAAFTPLDCSR